MSELRVAFIATECFPFVKIGGLADVIGALPGALASLGLEIDVVLPGFPSGGPPGFPHRDPATALRSRPMPPLTVGTQDAAASVHALRLPGSTVRVLVIEDGNYFPRAGVYVDPVTGRDYPDQADRWAFFQRAALALIAREQPGIDVIHCHEHQTALIPLYLDRLYRPGGIFATAATVLTIHNLGYQGIFPRDGFPLQDLGEGAADEGGPLEFFGQVNQMKGGIMEADALTVVSPTYAKEIQTPDLGYGLERVIADRSGDLFGILNGIDDVEWDPETDARIAARYSAAMPKDKQVDRSQLLGQLDLDKGTGPLLAMVSRVDPHKGFDLLLSLLDDLLRQDLRFVLLGTGDRSIESRITKIIDSNPGKAAARFVYDDALAHQVIAGADVFLMPSKYEPCGLTQMYALRYGTIPIVRRTGGLADTVQEFDPRTGTGTGFVFSSYDPDDFRRAIGRALALWQTPQWRRIIRNAMAADFSWTVSARRYLEVYRHAIRKRRGL